MTRSLAILGLLVGLFAGCSSSDKTQCVSDHDCYQGEVCRSDGYCGTPIPTVTTDAGGDQGGQQSGGDTATTSSGSDTGGSTTADMGTTQHADIGSAMDAGGTDTGPDAAMQACVVDPFVQCTDNENPDNNSFPGQYFDTMTRGCQSSGFVSMDKTVSGRICALDPADIYEFTYVECDQTEPGFVVEATLTVKDGCDPSLIHFDVGGIGPTCDNPDNTISCTTLADGSQQIKILFPGTSNPIVNGIRFYIDTYDRMDVQFDYDLHIVVRQ